MNVEEEIQKLEEEIHRLGSVQPDGSYKVSLSLSLLADALRSMFDFSFLAQIYV